MELKDFKFSFKLQKTTNESKSLVIRFNNPLTGQRDRCKTINFLKVKSEEYINKKVISSDKRKVDLFQQINENIAKYITLLSDFSLFDEDDLMEAIEQSNTITTAKKNLQILIVDIMTESKNNHFKANPNLTPKAKEHYPNAIRKFEEFQASNKMQYTIHHLDYKLMIAYENYLLNNLKHKTTTARNIVDYTKKMIADYLREVNDLMKLAFLNGYQSPIKEKKKNTKKVVKPYLTIDEVFSIYETNFNNYKPKNHEEKLMLKRIQGLNNIRDWIVIGFHIAQRMETLRALDNSQIKDDKIVNVYQNKTDNTISHIPMYGAMEDYFSDKKEFPYMCGRKNDFNEGVRLICEIMGFDEMMVGDIRQKVEIYEGREEMRDVRGVYPRWQLVASHTLRRSFVTHQHIEKRPADLGMAITGHKDLNTYNKYNQMTDYHKVDVYAPILKEQDKYTPRKKKQILKDPKIIEMKAS
ncbi:phage integrase SAM-like domain-containing protein [Paenimyroides baculatum]|uniref:Phage integrase family protein n=1 Tax=Paenimyroides baculatum TaxID=2608000 RepID=A0A5M6CGH6_9FLAO|nr:phage integrase SAM-like domain-containing protein [Paenimyroides baculatum]KAA5534294.1 hypothetical protein F0460_09305 [Paenimyroides baculatum]